VTPAHCLLARLHAAEALICKSIDIDLWQIDRNEILEEEKHTFVCVIIYARDLSPRKKNSRPLAPPRAMGPPPASGRRSPPSTPSLHRRRRLRSSGEALATPVAAACLYPRLGERVGALLVPGGGAPRKTLVRRGREVVVRWHLAVARGAGQRAALVAIGGCLAPIWQPGP
jgi:hypothetical protein